LPALKPAIAGSDASCPTPTSAVFFRSDVGFVMMNDVMPRVDRFGSVTAVTTKISPTPPCVMNRFDPFSTK
jgi:hypothetical protein